MGGTLRASSKEKTLLGADFWSLNLANLYALRQWCSTGTFEALTYPGAEPNAKRAKPFRPRSKAGAAAL